MKHLAILLAVLLFALAGSMSRATTLTLTTAAQMYQAAHRAYQAQDFSKARENYLQIAEAGYQSRELFYNLGTTAARLGLRGEAVLYLEKARLIGPRNSDVLANLRKVAPVENPLTGAGPSEPVRWLTGTFSLATWSWMLFGALMVACTVGALRLTFPSGALRALLKPLLWLSTSAAVIVAIFTVLKYYQQEWVQNAVIMQPTASLRSGPAEKFTQIETLAEGTVVRHLGDAAEDWVQVQLGDGRKGYIPENSARLI